MRKKTLKRGYTLIELCISIAVVAIVATAIVTFCTLMSTRVRLTRSYNDAAQDAEMIKIYLDNWIYGFSSPKFEVTDEGALCVSGQKECSAYFDKNANTFIATGDNAVEYRASGEMSINFSVKNTEDKQLIIGKIIYTTADNAQTEFVLCYTVYSAAAGEGTA